MSDQPQGPGWWQATDGKWYAPQPDSGPSGTPFTTIDSKAFVKSLYDFHFDSYVTPRVLRFVYAVVVILLSLGAVLFLISGFASGDSGTAIAVLIGVPIGYFLYIVFARIYFEIIAAFFRMADDVRAIRRDAKP